MIGVLAPVGDQLVAEHDIVGNVAAKPRLDNVEDLPRRLRPQHSADNSHVRDTKSS